ncbi:spermidine/putrescine ABC transporter substrate-binding protein [Desulfuribacillus stibiiarsenatis]|uniref:Spermidine/putrescine ABC transporter substrate-binding protein n=1 Tax=Desulfuribacillus stibiiarsenatis TaxID=1390249 RepID=A0A1E5L574_9FIRM|nr:spermidine/putrescine ABC transporter substrate-binding protein [Desulfuribacillus stibiiarsenatis]OEH85285.1 spermidine/putrescine ABC transporter substrate-binding protein [Desulfuribacillus stibiiarsenatis]
MKKIALLFLISMMVFTMLTGCFGSKQEVLNIYSWADNFDPDVIADFEKQFNVKVNYDVFSSNEEMLAKLQAGASQYDIIQPSDYMVEIMIELGLLEELNKDNIPNVKNIVSNFQTPPFDPQKQYSLVYTWGVTGIAYNPKYVTDPITSWNDLWNDKYKGRVVLLNDPREVIGMSLIKNGFSNSTEDANELKFAVDDLKQLLPNVLAFDTDTIKQKFIAEEAWIGTVWSGDAAFIAEENENIAYVVPEEGGTIWADTIAIPKGAKNKELAEKFINFLLEPQVSVRNYESIGYSNPNEQAYPLHTQEYLDNNMIFLDEAELNRTEWLIDVGDLLREYDRAWTELRSGR